MIKILITGKNSYIGKNLEKLLSYYPNRYLIDSISLRDNSWKKVDLSTYDVVIHVAAIVHKKETPSMENLYFQVNRDLPIEVANKAKAAGVKQFIFMSTMAVYGEDGKIGKSVIITRETKPNPNNFYGQSKLEAECELKKLSNKDFNVLVLRPPMIYGPNCPGNYTTLKKFAEITPVFPLIENQRSMLHIDKLCVDIKTYIDTKEHGLFFPQDNEYVRTSSLVKNLAEESGKKIYLSKTLGSIINIFGKNVKIVNKVFGNLVYEKN